MFLASCNVVKLTTLKGLKQIDFFWVQFHYYRFLGFAGPVSLLEQVPLCTRIHAGWNRPHDCIEARFSAAFQRLQQGRHARDPGSDAKAPCPWQ